MVHNLTLAFIFTGSCARFATIFTRNPQMCYQAVDLSCLVQLLLILISTALLNILGIITFGIYCGWLISMVIVCAEPQWVYQVCLLHQIMNASPIPRPSRRPIELYRGKAFPFCLYWISQKPAVNVPVRRKHDIVVECSPVPYTCTCNRNSLCDVM